MRYLLGELGIVGLSELAHLKRHGREGAQCVVHRVVLLVLRYDKRVGERRLVAVVHQLDQIVRAVDSNAFSIYYSYKTIELKKLQLENNIKNKKRNYRL